MSELRRLGPDDWQVFREIRLRALAHDPGTFGSTLARERGFGEEDWRVRAADTVVVLDNGRPIALGGVWWDEPGRVDQGMVIAMWTEPDRRGEGHGGRVLDEAVAMIRERGWQPYLFLMEGNPGPAALYAAHGFVRVGEPVEHGRGVAQEWQWRGSD